VSGDLQLYRGPKLEVRYGRRLGSPLSVMFVVDGKPAAYAMPSDFIALRAWWEAELKKMTTFMGEPEDGRVAENLRGDTPGET
jgi:hypothetical protein